MPLCGLRCCSYGAMMTLALGMGTSLPLMVLGTSASQPSSWPDRVPGLPSYQLWAWVASRVPFCRDMMMCFQRTREVFVWPDRQATVRREAETEKRLAHWST